MRFALVGRVPAFGDGGDYLQLALVPSYLVMHVRPAVHVPPIPPLRISVIVNAGLGAS